MVEINTQTLSEDEAALYDRQIRLWGLDAQKRLRAANVLVAGACGVGAEVIKNLVLAGVNTLDIMDHRKVTKQTVCSNFLAPSDSIGQNVSEASLERAQTLNPMVQVKAIVKSVDELTEEELKKYNVVCLCSCTKDQLVRINNICHDNRISFYSGDVFGMHGFMFADLVDHEYVEEVKKKVETDVGGRKEMVEETKVVKREEKFVNLCDALSVDWSSQKYGIRLKRTTPSLFIMHVLQEFECLYKRRPDPSNREGDSVELLTIKNSLLDKMNVPATKLSNEFALEVFGQVSPVCAVVGGVLAQEIIKAVSGKDQPHNNFFFFNPDEGAGVVDCFGP